MVLVIRVYGLNKYTGYCNFMDKFAEIYADF